METTNNLDLVALLHGMSPDMVAIVVVFYSIGQISNVALAVVNFLQSRKNARIVKASTKEIVEKTDTTAAAAKEAAALTSEVNDKVNGHLSVITNQLMDAQRKLIVATATIIRHAKKDENVPPSQ